MGKNRKEYSLISIIRVDFFRQFGFKCFYNVIPKKQSYQLNCNIWFISKLVSHLCQWASSILSSCPSGYACRSSHFRYAVAYIGIFLRQFISLLGGLYPPFRQEPFALYLLKDVILYGFCFLCSKFSKSPFTP